MAYRKKTLRRMPEHSRKLARLIGELASVTRKLKNELANIEELERSYLAEQKRLAHYNGQNAGQREVKPSGLADL